jgi:threonine dehydratase
MTQLIREELSTRNQIVRPTTIIESDSLSNVTGAKLTIATETFQVTGSFKFRAAYNLVTKVPETTLITASSGNFGQAFACACAIAGKTAIVVMPTTSAKVKIEATRSYGAIVDLVDTSTKSRAQRVSELAAENPGARICSAYDDPLVIEGNATLGTELAQLNREIDFVIVPIGGGGLSSGIVSGLKKASRNNIQVIGAEPLLANDASKSLKAGKIIELTAEPPTLADGARTISLGKHNWEILKTGLKDIVEVPEDLIEEAVRLYFNKAHLKVEPTGALALGAVLARPELFRGKNVMCIVSGGNVDPETYFRILSKST